MFRFVHSADWQLGARFSQFESAGARLREARVETLKRTLSLAEEREADAFLIAGDLFEDSQVGEALVSAVVGLFRAHPALPIYILPGNHDPSTGPDSVWQRKAFLNRPPNVHILTEDGVTDLGGNTFLLASPIRQKLSVTDPSQKLTGLAAGLPAESLKIGITHGALAIEAKHQPNDFPIALNAASRAGLDYLAVGHWHNWLADIDGGRIVMPGTPEPDRFGSDASGRVAVVELAGHGQLPNVEPVAVATLAWRQLAFDFISQQASRATVETALAELAPRASHTVIRLTLEGTASPVDFAAVRSWLEPTLASFLVGQIIDRTRIALSTAELADLQARHPLFTQVLADIDRLETLATGTMPIAQTNTTEALAAIASTLTSTEAQELLAPSRIDLARLTPEFFAQLRQMLLQAIQEVQR